MRNKNLFLIYCLFKGGDDTFDTKALNLADVSSFSPCMVNLLLRIVQNASWTTNFGFAAHSSNSQLVTH